MRTLTLRIDGYLDRWLNDEAKRLGRTKSQLVRESLLRQGQDRKRASVHDEMKDVCGIIKGAPGDLSARTSKYLRASSRLPCPDHGR